MVSALAKSFKPLSIAEIGVANGLFSRFLIDQFHPLRFDALDLFELHLVPEIWGVPSQTMFKNNSHYGFYCKQFEAEISAKKVNVYKGDSSTLMASSGALYDLIYIDGDHAFDGVKKDLEAALGKVAPGGILIFNDYIKFDHIGHTSYGIIENVNELVSRTDWKVCAFAFECNMFCDIAICRSDINW